MRNIVLLSLMILFCAAPAAAQTKHIVVDTQFAQEAQSYIAEEANDIAATIKKKWRKANKKKMSKTELSRILGESKIIYANRYAASPIVGSQRVDLLVASKPAGLVMLMNGETALGMAYTNEAGGVEYTIFDSEMGPQNKVAKLITDEDGFIACGLNQPYKLFTNKDGKDYVTDIDTGETSEYNSEEQIPDYVYTGRKHHTGAVIGTVCGSVVVVAIIALAAVL